MEGRVEPGYYPEFPINRILKPKFSFREDLSEDIDGLMYQIHAAGMIIEPLICRPSSKPGYVELGPGERRLQAAEKLGLKTVPVIVREMSDAEFDRVRLLENLARKDLSDIEIARILRYMLDNYPEEYPTQEDLAKAFGKTRQWVSYHLKMLELEDLSTRVDKWTEILSKITEKQARQILSVPPEKRVEVAKWIAERYEAAGEVPSAREIRGFVQGLARVNVGAEAVAGASEEAEREEKAAHVTAEGSRCSQGAVRAEGSVEEAEPRFCPLCGRRLEPGEYERLKARFKELLRGLGGK